MKHTFFPTIATWLLCTTAFAQDSLMLAQGTIRDVRTNKALKATIRYSSIPTGSITGNFNDSTFSFPIFGTAKYQITAEADGYSPRTVILDPKDLNDSLRIKRDIRLTPSGETIRLNRLIFQQGKSQIDPESFQELDEIAQMLKENEQMVIQLEGHTDNIGNAKGNLKLSQGRVEAVKKYLIKTGVSKNRVKTKAFGGTKPLGNEMTPEDRALNRRVEMRILHN
jgi:outer membrane protein OmpA-like peptidoglycan-associated protein